jgi:hypothetical protein
VGIFTPGTPLQQWKLDYFLSPANTGEGADGADPNSNGLPNLVEYALGADPLAGASSDPLGPGSPNGLEFLPYATISTNAPLTGQPAMRVNLPDPPPGDVELLACASTNLTDWSDIATRTGTNNWQWLAPGPDLVMPNASSNGRALFDIGWPASIHATSQFMQLQVESAP